MENQGKCKGCEQTQIKKFGYCNDCCNAWARKKYHENREERLAKMKIYNSNLVECECGCIIQYGCLPKHRKSDKHNQLIQSTQKIDADTKLCSICKSVKNKNEFYKSKQSKDGFSYRCKLCEKTRKKKQ